MNWYVLIVVPSEKVCDLIDRYRKKYAKYTKYKIPPHITIYPPFLLDQSSEIEIIKSLKIHFSKTRPFQTLFRSINYFEGRKNNVVYFEPDKKSKDKFKYLLSFAIPAFQAKIKNSLLDKNFTLEKYTPHMTIAERIPADILPSIKNDLSKLKVELKFKVSSVFLYVQGKQSVKWEKLKEIRF